MKRVSCMVAKAIKEAGYKFTPAPSSFFTNETNSWFDDEDGELYSLPFVLEVWLWLGREKGIKIDTTTRFDSIKGWLVMALITNGRWTCDVERSDPEEAIGAAVEHLVDNDLIK